MLAAMKVLQDAKCDFYIHTGDVGSELILDQLTGLPCAFVFGNNDFDRMEMGRYAEKLGINCYGNFGDLALDGKRIAVMHGDDIRLKQRVIAEQRFDYLFLGHSHVRLDERAGKTRIINPGALHRAAAKTVVTLDTATDQLSFLLIDESR